MHLYSFILVAFVSVFYYLTLHVYSLLPKNNNNTNPCWMWFLMTLIFLLAEHEPPEFRLLNGPDSNGPVEEPETEEIFLKRTRGPLGLSIVGGVDHSSHLVTGPEGTSLASSSQRWEWGAVVSAQWIIPRTLNREVPGSNLLAVAVVPLGRALYPLIA